jgi:hypothetical protein
MYAHVHQAASPIENVRPDCPEGLRAAVMRMLAKDPVDRWPSVEDVIAAIGSPTLTPDDPTRSQLIAIAKTGQRRAIGVTTPKSPIPLMRTPIPLSSTPRTGAVAMGVGPTGTEPGVAAAPANGPAADVSAATAPGTPVPVVVRRHSSPLSLALAGGGLLVAIAAIAVAIRSRTTASAAPARDTGAASPAAVITPPPHPVASAPAEPSTPAPEASAAERSRERKAAASKKPAAAGKTASPVTDKPPAAAPESAVVPPAASTSAEPAPQPPASTPAAPARPSGTAPGVSGAAALLGAGGTPGPARSGPPAADRKAIEAAIRGYAAALDGGSTAQALRAFPTMPGVQQSYLESFFGAGGRMRTDWKVSSVTLEGDQAKARVRGTTRSTPGGGNPALDQVDAQVTLERTPDGWRLRSFGGPGRQ